MEEVLEIVSKSGAAIANHNRYKMFKDAEVQLKKDDEAKEISEELEKQSRKIHELEKDLKPVEVEDILKPVWFLAFQKTKSWLQLYSGKIVFGFFRKSFWDEYKKKLQQLKKKVASNQSIQKFLKVQTDYVELMTKINKRIEAELAPEKE